MSIQEEFNSTLQTVHISKIEFENIGGTPVVRLHVDYTIADTAMFDIWQYELPSDFVIPDTQPPVDEGLQEKYQSAIAELQLLRRLSVFYINSLGY
jgi:hypothetical protein